MRAPYTSPDALAQLDGAVAARDGLERVCPDRWRPRYSAYWYDGYDRSPYVIEAAVRIMITRDGLE